MTALAGRPVARRRLPRRRQLGPVVGSRDRRGGADGGRRQGLERGPSSPDGRRVAAGLQGRRVGPRHGQGAVLRFNLPSLRACLAQDLRRRHRVGRRDSSRLGRDREPWLLARRPPFTRGGPRWPSAPRAPGGRGRGAAGRMARHPGVESRHFAGRPVRRRSPSGPQRPAGLCSAGSERAIALFSPPPFTPSLLLPPPLPPTPSPPPLLCSLLFLFSPLLPSSFVCVLGFSGLPFLNVVLGLFF